MLPDADDQAADQVDEQDQHRGDRVAAHELAGAVHRAEEIRLAADLLTPACRLFLVDEPGVEIGVDRHLLARHPVEHEARRDLGDAPGALGDDDEIDDDEDREDRDADRVIAADDKGAERFDDPPGGVGALIAVQQDDPRRRDVERQPQQRRHQEQGRER